MISWDPRPHEGGKDYFVLDIARRELTIDSRRIHVEPKVFDFIVLLAGRCCEVLESDVISAELWPDERVCPGALRQCVWSARRVLRDSAKDSLFIRTAHRRGYLFVGNVVMESRTAWRLSSAGPGALRAARLDGAPEAPGLRAG